jgi:hypothetical protein
LSAFGGHILRNALPDSMLAFVFYPVLVAGGLLFNLATTSIGLYVPIDLDASLSDLPPEVFAGPITACTLGMCAALGGIIALFRATESIA